MVLSYGFSMANDNYGNINTDMINNGKLQLTGTIFCKKYFYKCLLSGSTGVLSEDRVIVNVPQYVIMQTGITNPEIVSVDVVRGENKIVFIYDQNREHSLWVPEYEKD